MCSESTSKSLLPVEDPTVLDGFRISPPVIGISLSNRAIPALVLGREYGMPIRQFFDRRRNETITLRAFGPGRDFLYAACAKASPPGVFAT
jgi:hypothetical protein